MMARYYYYSDINVGGYRCLHPDHHLGRAPRAGHRYEELNYLSDSWKDSFSGTVDALDYILSLRGWRAR